MKRLIFLFACTLPLFTVYSQNATLIGTVSDSSETLIGASIVLKSGVGTSSDINGKYSISVEPGTYNVKYSSIGYEDQVVKIDLSAGSSKTVNITLAAEAKQIGTVVISTSKYGKRIEEETVSMDVLKPKLIESSNNTDAKSVVEKAPGILIADGQISIRGGSGYAYGVGSRAIMVIDGIPLLSPERSEIQWDFVPIENIEQMEIVKGAASVQYGASALSGIVHVRTSHAKKEPETKIVAYNKLYAGTPEKDYNWWKDDSMPYGQKPHETGVYFSHKRRFGNLDLVVGGQAHSSQSHLVDEYNDKYRGNFKLRYRPKNVEGLSFGINGNVMHRNQGFFFFWQDTGDVIYKPAATYKDKQLYLNVDPFIHYYDKKNFKHQLNTRFYHQKNLGSTHIKAQFYYADYQLQKKFDFGLNALVGATNTHIVVGNDDLRALFPDSTGKFNGDISAIYTQADYKWRNLTVAVGGRFEYLRLDTAALATKPVFRAGINYQLKENNFFRAAFGQSFRVPSLAERYVKTKQTPLFIDDNPDIQPEEGYTFELGYKRSLKIKDWHGYVDVAAFWTEFENMVEFKLTGATTIDGTLHYIFRTENTSLARIAGLEFSVAGDGKIGKVPVTLSAGYTYIYPVDLNKDGDTLQQKKFTTFAANTFGSFGKIDEDIESTILLYRNRHMLKFNLVADYKKFSFGTNVNYYSYMENIDLPLEIFINGLSDYRQNHTKGDVEWNANISYDVTKFMTVNLIANNILNSDYAIRAAKPNAPRNFVTQLRFKF